MCVVECSSRRTSSYGCITSHVDAERERKIQTGGYVVAVGSNFLKGVTNVLQGSRLSRVNHATTFVTLQFSRYHFVASHNDKII